MITLHFLHDGSEFDLNEEEIESIQDSRVHGGTFIVTKTAKRTYEVQESRRSIRKLIEKRENLKKELA